jgi:hypothetical protein
VLRRRYQLCTAVFAGKFGIATAVMVPLYLAREVVALGIASTLLTLPAMAACTCLSWRIPRAEGQSASRM